MSHKVWVTFISCLSALGAFLFGLDIGYIAPILECESFKREIAGIGPNEKIPDAVVGFIVSIFSIGCVIASIPTFAAYFLDVWGRRSSIVLGSCIFLVGCATQTMAVNLKMILVGRFAAGLSIGLLSAVVALYQSEIAPPSMRGSLTSIYQLMITLGILVAVFIDYALVEKEGGWRIAIALQAVPACILFFTMPFMPESPRWLVQRGLHDKALEALMQVRSSEEEAQKELDEIASNFAASSSTGEAQWWEIYQGRPSRLLRLGMSLQMLQQLCGMNAFMYFGPRIFISLGLDGLRIQTAINSVNFLGTFVAICFADISGRCFLLMWGAAGMCFACFGMGSLEIIFGPTTGQPGDTAAGPFSVAMALLFVASFSATWGPVVWVYTAEMFPLVHRSRSMAMTTMTNWVGNFIIAQFTPIVFGRCGFSAFYIFGIMSVACLGIASWIPETKGVPLEDVDKLFDECIGPASKMKLGITYGTT